MARSKPVAADSSEPVILPRAEHALSRKQISENTLKVLYRLARHGHKAYLVGGGVRDLLLGRQPKDFDVGTDATPEQIREAVKVTAEELANVNRKQGLVERATLAVVARGD